MEQVIRKTIDWYLISYKGLSRDTWFLALVTLINRSGTIVALFLSIYMVEKLGFSKSQTAIVLACSGIGSFIGAYLGGVLTDRFGYYKVMFGSLISTGLFFFVLMKITSFIPLCIGFVLLGIIGDSYRPASATALSVYEVKEQQARALSLYRLAINMGFVVGSAGAGFIAGSWGYDWLFIIDGLTCIFAGIFFLTFLKNKESIIQEEKNEDETNGRSPYTDTWYLMFLFSLFISGIAFMQLFHSFPVYCREVLFLSEEAIGGYMAYNGALICLLEMPMIYLIVKYKKETPSIIWGIFLFALSFVFLNLGLHWFFVILFMTFVVIGEIMNFPLTYKIALNRSSAKTRGQYMGMFSMMFSVVAIVAPFGLKLAENTSFYFLWWICVGLCCISTLALYGLRRGMEG